MPPLADRRLVIDATFPWRIASELSARGFREATSPRQLGDQKIKDPPLLKLLYDTLEPCVLVTYDQRMAVEHRDLLEKYGTTLAVVDKNAKPAHLLLEEYWRDVIHHHAHRIARQEAGTLVQYGQRAGRRIT